MEEKDLENSVHNVVSTTVETDEKDASEDIK
jgi:hypothetical protein